MTKFNEKEKSFEEFYRYVGIHHAENTAKEADDILEKSKDLDFPKELDTWFDGYIRKAGKKERSIFKMKLNSWPRRVATAFLALILVGFITTMSVEAYRIKFFNIATNITEKYTEVSIEREEERDESNFLADLNFYPQYIPEGYRQSEVERDKGMERIYFENNNGDVIEFVQMEFDPEFQVDTENVAFENIKVNGAEGIFVEKENNKTLFWFTESYTFYIRARVSYEDMIYMAESLENIK